MCFPWSILDKVMWLSLTLKMHCDPTGFWSRTACLHVKKKKKNFFGVYSLKRKTKYLETWFMSVCNHNWWLHPCGATASLIFSFANNISWLFLFCGAFRTESNTSQCVLVMESDDGTKRKKTRKVSSSGSSKVVYKKSFWSIHRHIPYPHA